MFTLPLYDDNPTNRVSFITWIFLAACVAVFLWQQGLPGRVERVMIYRLGMIPAVLLGKAELPPEIAAVPAWASLLTSMFLHGGWMHLLGNMLYLWIFGNNVEDSMGHVRFILFYLLCGIAAALTQALAAPHSELPMIGASGAIAGVLGGYLMLHPKANVRVLVWIVIFIRLINVPAVWVLGLWFLAQFWSGATTQADQGGVAFWAHVGGFVTGMVLVPFFKDAEVPLFGARRTQAFEVLPARTTRRGGSVPPAGGRHGPWGPRDDDRHGPWG